MLTEVKQKRKYVRKATLRPEAPPPIPVGGIQESEEIHELEITPFQSAFTGIDMETAEREPEPPVAAESRRDDELAYIIGIIDALALKHASRHKLSMNEVRDDLLVGIIKNIREF